MFKRANKITSLLVAAASVMSLVPAMAADTTRLGTKEGTIDNAVAYSDGKYVYEGYKTDSSDDSVYYNAGDKDKELTDLTDANLLGSYENKYAFAQDGSDEYLVDLSNGSVIDDETPADREDTAATKLKSKLNDSDRYGDAITVTSANLDQRNTAKFSDVWYQYQVDTNSGDADDYVLPGTRTLTGYTNDSGKYIDTSYVANVYAYSTAKQKVVKIDNFSNKINDEDTDTKLQATLLEAPEFLAQDKDNIYQKVTVRIKDKYATAASSSTTVKVNYAEAGTTEAALAPAGTPASANVAFTLGANVTFNGKVYTWAAATEAGKWSTAAELETLIDADGIYAATLAADGTGTVQAVTNGVKTTLVSAAGTVITSFVNGTEPGTAVLASTFEIGKAAAITYSAGSVATDLTTYKNAADLKTKVEKLIAINGVDHFVNTPAGAKYDSITQTFTLAAAETGAEFNNDGDATTVYSTTAGNKMFDKTYIQKISKAQGENKDGGLVPKSVASYELSKNYYDCGDADDAFDADDAKTSYVVTNGTLFAIKNSGTNVKVTTMNLKKDKVKFESGLPATGFDAANKVDVYLVEKGDDDDTDVQDAGAVSIDVDGNVWAINEGKIYKFESGEFKVQFTADRSMDQLDVYDAKSMIAWEDAGDVYTTVNEGTSVTQSESTAVAPVVVTGWVQDGANWSFNDATGTKVTNKWVNVGGAWYFLKADGVMATNWYNDNGTWYYLKSSGAMATGWVNDNGTWYYCNASGAMLANTTVDGYVLNASGAWVK